MISAKDVLKAGLRKDGAVYDLLRESDAVTAEGEGASPALLAKELRLSCTVRREHATALQAAREEEETKLKTDIEASNGVIHVIDSVILPPTKTSQSSDCPASRLIKTAIREGAELYNAGSPEGCAAVYEVALRSMVELGRAYLPGKSRARITRMLENLPSDADEKAWALRKALDGLYGKIQRAPEDVHESAK